MDAHLGYSDKFTEAITKISEGYAILEQENNRIKEITVSQKEALDYYRVTLPTLIKRRKANLIPCILFGNHYRYFIDQKGGLCHSK